MRRPIVGAALLLTALTVMLTWPQALHLGTHVSMHQDPMLSLWRLSWLAHALTGDPRHLFDGNIFYPNGGTFAYSDATLLQGLLAAPWLWAHVNPVAVYNVLLLTGIVSSGLGMFVLVRYLTDNVDAALVSAAIFTLVPYRVEHFMHLEIQWTVWMPLTFWAIHQAFDRGTVRSGLLAGVFLFLQVISCVYYGAYLGIIVMALAILLALTQPERVPAAGCALAFGAIAPALLTALYAQPYLSNARLLGPRDPGEIANFSARLASYITAPPQNWAWGWTALRFGGNELHLFPGVLAVALAVVGLGFRPRRVVWIYAGLAALSVELSLGLHGTLYPWMHAHLPGFNGFRAPARFAILSCCALAVVAGFGFEALQRLVHRPGARRALMVGTLVAIGLEYGSAPMPLRSVSTDIPDAYTFLRGVYPSVIVELPFEDWDMAPEFMYWSTYHWNQLVNGYSGHQPRSYVETQERMRSFPDDASLERLKALKVRYILVHQFYFKSQEYASLMAKLAERTDLIAAGRFRGPVGSVQIFEMKQ